MQTLRYRAVLFSQRLFFLKSARRVRVPIGISMKKITIFTNQLLLKPVDDGIGRFSSISFSLTLGGRMGWQVPKFLFFFCCLV